MTLTIPQDTPITRASIEQMPIEQLDEFVHQLQERRLRAYSIYQAAQQSKAEKQFDKDAEMLEKRLEQFIKTYETSTKQLEKLEKYAMEILGLRLALGHDITLPIKTSGVLS